LTSAAGRPDQNIDFFALFYLLLILGAVIIDTLIADGDRFIESSGPAQLIVGLLLLLPSLAVSVRRLHDLDASGWWILIGFIPLIGAVILVVWFCMRGTSGTNRFGSDPVGSV
jgi:uncharacterized membrane protein YhaH (DUF805 family)